MPNKIPLLATSNPYSAAFQAAGALTGIAATAVRKPPKDVEKVSVGAYDQNLQLHANKYNPVNTYAGKQEQDNTLSDILRVTSFGTSLLGGDLGAFGRLYEQANTPDVPEEEPPVVQPPPTHQEQFEQFKAQAKQQALVDPIRMQGLYFYPDNPNASEVGYTSYDPTVFDFSQEASRYSIPRVQNRSALIQTPILPGTVQKRTIPTLNSGQYFNFNR